MQTKTGAAVKVTKVGVEVSWNPWLGQDRPTKEEVEALVGRRLSWVDGTDGTDLYFW